MLLQALKTFQEFQLEVKNDKVSNFSKKDSCPICSGSSACYKCQISDLQRQVNELTEVVNFLCGDSSRQLQLKKHEILLVDKTFIRLSELALLPIIEEREYVFITLTFDPEKFGQNNDSEDEKKYLLHLIAQLIKTGNLSEVYGSFEYQRNGSVHCHFISKFSDYGYIKQHFKKGLTNRPRNEKAVDIKPVKGIQKLWDYINKEPNGKEWFTSSYDSYYQNGLDYGL